MNESTKSAPELLQVVNLQKHFPVRAGLFGRVRDWVRAVDGVSFSLPRGKTLGLVGESGCGKTTVGRTLLRLTRATGGNVLFEGQSLLQLDKEALRKLRRKMQIIFQDPYSSLNPRWTVGEIVGEALWIHEQLRGAALKQRVLELLSEVGLPPEAFDRFPHEFSGGQRQRIGIARALALRPSLIVCDEPTSALDVSIRAQIINLLARLQHEHDISLLMISHDLGVVRHLSHEVAVMYLGRIVEHAPTRMLFSQPCHPYTRLLLSAIPVPDPSRPRPTLSTGDDEVPSPIRMPSGCPFHPRCPLYLAKGRPAECHTKLPDLLPVRPDSPQLARCHFPQETPATSA